MSKTIADIRRKYDVQFQQMMKEMFEEIQPLVTEQHITALSLGFSVESVERREEGKPGLAALLLRDASLSLDVTYGG